MRAHQIMTHQVITVSPETSTLDAANMMLRNHISGLPVLDSSGALIGIVSEGDFLRRTEIGTPRKRAAWLRFFTSPGRLADDFVSEQGRSVADVMTADPVTVNEETELGELVSLMERKGVKRLPVMRQGRLVGIVTRSNLLQAFASMAKEIPDPTADDGTVVTPDPTANDGTAQTAAGATDATAVATDPTADDGAALSAATPFRADGRERLILRPRASMFRPS